MRKYHLWAAASLALLAANSPASANLTLTSAGTSDGFSLSTFYSNPSAYYGLLGVTTTPGGSVIGAGYATSTLSLFNDVDGQTSASALKTVTVPGTVYEVASVGGNVYYDNSGGSYYAVNPTTLAITPLSLTPATTPYLGLWANPVTGHLIASSYSGIVDINPLTGTVHVITTAATGADGVTVSPDGTIAYVELNGHIYGYNIATGTQVADFTSDASHSPDGTGVINGGTFNGDIVVNNNDGTVGLIDVTTGIDTIIASGGTRGDFVGPDLTNGTLFLASADATERLALAGATIGGGPPPTTGVPEPVTLSIFGAGLAGAVAMRRRRRKKA